MAYAHCAASHWGVNLIPTGMMRVKAVVTGLTSATPDVTGQNALVFTTVLYSPVVYIESAIRSDHMDVLGLGVNEKTIIHAPWYPGLKNGMVVSITDGAVTTAYQIESIEDDRMKHRQVKLLCVRAENQL